MEFHPEVMPEAQRRVLKAGAPVVSENRFYLAGGTAIAIYLGHRESVDLDWFTGESLGDPLDLAHRLRTAGLDLEVSSVARGTVHASSAAVKLNFLGYRYPLLRPAVAWPEYGCELASLEDPACMKLSAVSSRGARKDLRRPVCARTGTVLPRPDAGPVSAEVPDERSCPRAFELDLFR